MKNEIGMASPWVIYAKKVDAMFSGDRNVKVEFDEATTTINIYVDDFTGKKADAIEKLLPSEVPMGNITVIINVIPCDADEEPSYDELVSTAFSGNSNFCGIVSESHGILPTYTYGLFKNNTIQYYDDDLTKYGGINTMVMSDLVSELMTPPTGFYFSTEVR